MINYIVNKVIEKLKYSGIFYKLPESRGELTKRASGYSYPYPTEIWTGDPSFYQIKSAVVFHLDNEQVLRDMISDYQARKKADKDEMSKRIAKKLTKEECQFMGLKK